MTRSRKRKLRRSRAKWVHFPLASALFAGGAAHAETSAETGGLDEIVVTAQKRVEDLQKVPISMQVLGGEKLAELQVASFDDYAKFLPSVSFQSTGPGQAQLFFRGIASGGDGLHAGSESATGLYLDETPVTTIGSSLDLHVYDIQRVEALAGPQGTLYGASSLSGTLRIITNKPDPTKFSAGYDVKADKFGKGGPGGGFEGFVNIPLSGEAAIRLVGYYEKDGGYISNTYKPVTYRRAVSPDFYPPNGIPADPITVNNAAYAKRNFNDVETYGGRAALKVDLNDRWTVTPSVVYQNQKANGVFSYDPAVGDLQVTDYSKDLNVDHWYQSALTIEGKVSDWNILYSGGYFERQIVHQYDYSEYSIAYDAIAYTVAHLVDNQGKVIDPTQNVIGGDRYTKQTHELRFSSPADLRLRVTAGAFYQRQTDNIRYEYRYNNNGDFLASRNLITDPALNLTDIYSVDGSPGALYLAQELRTDHDYALFGDGSFDITDKLKLSAGIRGFVANNSLDGFFGFGEYFGGLASSGEGSCVTPVVYNKSLPCINVPDKHVRESGETHRVNLTYQVDPDIMLYGTYSTGFRPGGINRVPYLKDLAGNKLPVPPYAADTLKNFEFGWKTAWFDNRLRFNGAVFYEKWKDIQIGVNGPNGITSIFNAGNATSKGIESDLSWNILDNLNFSLAGTYVNARLSTDFCRYTVANGVPVTVENCAGQPDQLLAPRGTRLPVTPNLKMNATTRYRFALGGLNNFVQGSVLHRSMSSTYLKTADDQAIGDLPGFTTFDFALGTGMDNWNLEFYVENAFDERGVLGRNPQCVVGNCYSLARIYPAKPQLFGIKFGQKF
jgi:iron complex outermembrane receptor protein